jgi:hypothetical protein
LPRVAAFVEKHLRLVFVGGMVAVFLSLVFIALPGTLRFNPSMAALRPHDRAFEINGEIARAFSTRNPNKLNFIVSAPTEEEALEKAAAYEPKLRELEKEGLIVGYESVSRFLPSPAVQCELLKKMRAMKLDAAEKHFEEALKKRGLDPSYFSFNARLLKEHAALAASDKPLMPSDLTNPKLARLLATLISAKRSELNLGDGIPPEMQFPITLAKAAVTNETGRVIYPAGATLTRAQAQALIPANPEETDNVYALTYYANGFAVKSTIYLPVPKDSKDGEPQLTREWLARVAQVLGLNPEQFSAVESDQNFDAVLTGVPVASLVLADIVKEDFLRIAIYVSLICLATINLFYHPSPWRAFACSVPFVAFALLRYNWLEHWPDINLVGSVLGAIFVVGALVHRGLGKTLLCFMPVALGLAYMFGLIAFLNFVATHLGGQPVLDLNFVNVLTIPIIIGAGVDNGVHLTERYFEAGREIRPMVVDTGRALIITALTSIVGFGSLFLSKFQGLDSIAQLGTLSSLAFFMVLFASVVIFPACIATLAPKKQ